MCLIAIEITKKSYTLPKGKKAIVCRFHNFFIFKVHATPFSRRLMLVCGSQLTIAAIRENEGLRIELIST